MPRRNLRPTKAEGKKMMGDLIDLSLQYAYAKTLKRNAAHNIDMRPEQQQEHEHACHVVLNDIAPTFLVLKLGSIVEDAINILWKRRFPEIDPKRLRHEDKLRVMRELHGLDLTAFTKLWELRNTCAHKFDQTATWNDIDIHFSAVFDFIKKFTGDPTKLTLFPKKTRKRNH